MTSKTLKQFAIGGLIGVNVAICHAGSLPVFVPPLAREVVTSDSQAFPAPPVAFRFQGDYDARSSSKTMQIQLRLDSGVWASAGSASSFRVIDGVDGTLWTLSEDAGPRNYQIPFLGVSDDGKTLYATFQIRPGSDVSVLKQPVFTFAASGTKPTIRGLYSVVQAMGDCDDATYDLKGRLLHFVALSNPALLADSSNATPDEHLRAGFNGSVGIYSFPTNIRVQWSPSKGDAKIDATSGQTRFSGSAALGEAYVNSTVLNLGKVSLQQKALGYDADGSSPYVLTGRPANGGIDEKAVAGLSNGNVEAKSFDVVVKPSPGFAVGSTLSLSTAADCASGSRLVTSAPLSEAAAVAPVALSVPHSVNQLGFGGMGEGPLFVCYSVPGNSIIPSASFSVTGRLTKASSGGGFNEQDNSCSGGLYSLRGLRQVEVRNYANSKDPGGWMTVIRVINPSEGRTVEVYGQLIHPDGLYGPWGKIATLRPRAVQNLTSTQIDALLINAPSQTNSPDNGPALPLVDTTGSRLRITSPDAESLRVQTYLYNAASQNFIETSGSLGFDVSGAIGDEASSR